jgi:hypothetical protein
MSYDPNEIKYNVQETPESVESDNTETNYDRYVEPEDMSFEERLDAEAKAYQRQQDEAFDAEMQDSPLFKHSLANKYG